MKKNKEMYFNFIISAIAIATIFFDSIVTFDLFKFVLLGMIILDQIKKIMNMHEKNEKGFLLVSRLTLLISSLIFLIVVIIKKIY